MAGNGTRDVAMTVTREEVVAALGLETADDELAKPELDNLLLEKVGMNINEDILSNIFTECDADQSGLVSVDELVDYINKIEKPTNSELTRQNFWNVACTFTFPPYVVFWIAMIVNITIRLMVIIGGGFDSSFNVFGLTSIGFFVGCFVYNILAYDGIANDIDLVERAKEKVVLWAKNGFRAKGTKTSSPQEFDLHAELKVADLKQVLADSFVFLPYHALKKVFNLIDKDSSGLISFAEIQEFAVVHLKQGPARGRKRTRLIWSACLWSFDFWMGWLWTLGCILYIIAGYSSAPNAAYTYYGWGAIFFTLPGLGMFRPYLMGVNSSLDYAQEVNMVLHSLAVKSLQSSNENSEPVIDSSTVNVRAAAETLFAKMDVSSTGTGDGKLDFIELYDALTQAGFVCQLDVLRSIFNQADESGDGALQLKEFIDYIENIDTDITHYERTRDILKVIIQDTFFYLLLLQLLGGVMLIIGNYAPLSEVQGFTVTVVGTACWFSGIINWTITTFENNGRALRALTYSKLKFRNDILKAVDNDDSGRDLHLEGLSDEYQKTFEESASSFIVVSHWFNTPFNTALSIWCIQCFVYSLVCWGLITGDPGNPLGIPAAVSAPVLVAQIIALVISVCSQSDAVSGVSQLVEGYHQDSVEAAFPEASKDKWMLSSLLLLISGLLSFFTAFLLIVTSTDVVELLLNFTAIEFVSLLDDGAFLLSARGFLGRMNEGISKQIADTSFKTSVSKEKRRVMKMLLLAISFCALMFGWAVIYSRQLKGDFSPQTLIAQFDDEADVKLGTYSGIYVLEIRRLKFGLSRIRYIGEDGVGMFAYCLSEQAWTFSVEAYSDPCDKYVAISTESDDFDITATNALGWFATSDPELQRYYPMDNFFLGLPCEEDIDCAGVGRGICRKHRCVCNDPYYGWRCDFDDEATCEVIDVDLLLGPGFSGINSEYSERFYMLRKANDQLLASYYRPVYASDTDGAEGGNVMMFTGLRWGIFRLPPEFNITEQNGLLDYLDDDSIRNVELFFGTREYFFSDPIWFNTPGESASPVGVTWNYALTNEAVTTTTGSDAILFCAICNNETNPCFNDGFCPSSGFCECRHGATETLCRVPPTSNAVCNSEYFNSNEFGYDGGDCCESSCVSTDEQTCGFISHNDSEVVNVVNVQFPNCSDPAALCTPNANASQCWRDTSQPLPIETTSLNLALSANGKVLVQVTPDGVKVLDKVDSRWLQRGDDITDVRGSRFGERVSIFTPSSEVQGNIDNTGVNVIIVVGLFRMGRAGARVFYWDISSGSWLPVGAEISFCTTTCTLESIDIGNQRNVVSVVANVNGDTAVVHAMSFDDASSGAWQLVQSLQGDYASLSGNGQVLAVVSGARVTIYSIVGGEMNQNLQILNEGDVEELGANLTKVQATELSFDGQEMSFVVLNGAGDDFVMTLNTSKAIPPQRLNTESIGPLSRNAMRAGFNPSTISTDGSGVGVMIDTKTGPRIKSYHFESSFGWVPVDAVYWNDDLKVDKQFRVSAGASILAVESRSAVTALTLYPSCSEDSKKFRLSVPLKAAAGNVSWSLTSFAMIGNERFSTDSVREVCDGCYDDIEDNSLISVEGCTLRDECLELKYQDLDETGQSQPFFFFEDDSLLWSGIGKTSAQLQVLGEDCRMTIQDANCTQGQSWFMLALNLDQAVRETSWRLEDENRTVLLSGGSYEPSRGFVWLHSSCVPSMPQCLSFIMLDSFGDGTCCDLGEGRYSLFWQGEEVISRNGDQFDFGERVEFGTCPTRVVPPETITVTIFPDPNPEEILWYLEDSSGYRFGAGTDIGESVTVTTGFSNVVGCLYFTIEDWGGDGFSGYSISSGGETLTQTTSGAYGERIQLGEGCESTVTELTLLSVYIEFDNKPNETSWTLIDVVNDRKVGGAERGAYDSVGVNATVNEQMLVLRGGSYEFTLLDAGGDGFSDGNGLYVISLNQNILVTGGSAFGSSISHAITVPE